MIPRTTRSTLFPYTTLFRSRRVRGRGAWGHAHRTLPAAAAKRGPPAVRVPSRDSGGEADSLRSEEHTSELQSRPHLVCRLLLEKKNTANYYPYSFFVLLLTC